MYRYLGIFETGEAGGFVVTIPDASGVVIQGDSLADCLRNGGEWIGIASVQLYREMAVATICGDKDRAGTAFRLG